MDPSTYVVSFCHVILCQALSQKFPKNSSFCPQVNPIILELLLFLFLEMRKLKPGNLNNLNHIVGKVEEPGLKSKSLNFPSGKWSVH